MLWILFVLLLIMALSSYIRGAPIKPSQKLFLLQTLEHFKNKGMRPELGVEGDALVFGGDFKKETGLIKVWTLKYRSIFVFEKGRCHLNLKKKTDLDFYSSFIKTIKDLHIEKK